MREDEARELLLNRLGGDPEGHVAQTLARRVTTSAPADPVGALTVGETRFFRDPEALERLEREVFPNLPGGEPRVWSAGCSTGQEVYTIAYLAYRALGRALEVVGSDVSATRLARARSGVYPQRLLPESPPVGFAITEGDQARMRVPPGVRVRFVEHNLVHEPAPVRGADLVLCRNVLLYLSPEARRRALTTLCGAVRPAGFLALGEHDALRTHDAVPAGWERLTPTLLRATAPEAPPLPEPAPAPRPTQEVAATEEEPEEADGGEEGRRRLGMARAHLLAGNLGEAERVCVEVLDRAPTLPEGVALLAELACARGEPGVARAVLEAALCERPHDEVLERAWRALESKGGASWTSRS